MKKKYITLFLVTFVFCVSCSNKAHQTIESNKDGLYTIDLDKAIHSEDIFLYSTIYKGIETILLETNESCLIGSINKMRVSDKYIFILDTDIAKGLFVFDKKGNFVRKIGNAGHGPGEYVNPSDFTISYENNTIYILDYASNRINKYNLSTGIFIKSINIDGSVRSNNIEYVGGKLYADAYFSNHSDSNYLLRVIQETTGKEEKQYLNIAKYNKEMSNINFLQNNAFQFRANGNIVFLQWFMDHIIEINADSISSLIDIKGKNLLTSENLKNVMDKAPSQFMFNIWQLNKYFNITSFIENKNTIFFNYYMGFGLLFISFDKITNLVRIYDRIWDDLLIREKDNNQIAFLKAGCYDTKGVYYPVSTRNLSQIKSAANENALSSNLDRIKDLKNMDDDANPVIFYYKFKD
jgi:hypothetical protein